MIQVFSDQEDCPFCASIGITWKLSKDCSKKEYVCLSCGSKWEIERYIILKMEV